MYQTWHKNNTKNNPSHCVVIDDNLPCQTSQQDRTNHILYTPLPAMHDNVHNSGTILPPEDTYTGFYVSNIVKSGISTQNIKENLKNNVWKNHTTL